jgi:hypothetical protein
MDEPRSPSRIALAVALLAAAILLTIAGAALWAQAESTPPEAVSPG